MNTFDVKNDIGICYFNHDKGHFIFDKEDYEKIKGFGWYKNSRGYAVCDTQDGTFLVHRMIMNCPKGLVVDHINHNKLDNRKANLRVCSQSDNLKNQVLNRANTSGCKGVHFFKRLGLWQTYITVNKKRISLGYYKDFNEAVTARRNAEKLYFREYTYKEVEE